MGNEKRRNLLLPLSVAMILCLAACMAGCVWGLFTQKSVTFRVIASTEIFSILFAGLYLVGSFRKDSSLFYRLFFFVSSLSFLVETVGVMLDPGSTVAVTADPTRVLCLILYGNTLLLAVGKDLGKVPSLCLAGFNVLCYLCFFLGLFILEQNVTPSNKWAMIVLYATWLILSLAAFLMVVAKYTDKALRKDE